MEAQSPEIFRICQQFHLDETKMEEIVNRMTKELKMGLAKDTHSRASVKCYVTYVQDLPTGKESGKFLALDLGGTNFRVLLVVLNPASEVDISSKSYVISKKIMEGSGVQLFDFIAQSLAEFAVEHGLQDEELPLGFTFSFPCKQNSLNDCTLVTWTKGFKADDVVNKNVVQMLHEAIERRGDIKINIRGILNDTTGTLLSAGYYHSDCKIGLIVGTGSNACYVEKVSNAEMFNNADPDKPTVIINTEWGAFGENGVLDFIRTSYDEYVDSHSVNPKKQIFEKAISGMYIGEVVRLIVTDVMERGLLFKGFKSQALQQPGRFETRFISEIESDMPGTYRNAAMVMDNLGIRTQNEHDLMCLHHICHMVSKRSAKLVACGLVCLIRKMGYKSLTIGIDGSVYRYHPTYASMLMKNINLLLKGSASVKLALSEDGSGLGAAFVAAISSKK